ncbi:MAG: M14 family metallopeptidase [Pseudomonadota bacterium]
MLTFFSLILFGLTSVTPAYAHGGFGSDLIKVKATNKFERSRISNLGFAIEEVHSDHVVVSGNQKDIDVLRGLNLFMGVEHTSFSFLSFPSEDSRYHDHLEILDALDSLQEQFPNLVKVSVMGLSVEGRIIPVATLTVDPESHAEKPGIVFLGAHHAREHISAEVPLRHLMRFCEQYEAGDEEVVRLLSTRSLYFAPLINPDGKAYDLKEGRYKSWRKNRRLFGSNYGVDLNRNYSFMWGTGGSSDNPRSDVFMGLEPFSEPEIQAVKTFVENSPNLTSLLSYHSYGKLILYPWGHTYDSVGNEKDFAIFTTMAEKMALWNDYQPTQGSDLYVVSGNTIDWSYGEHGLISFTFELDPRGFRRGGFYPGDEIIDEVVEKNWRPVLFMTEYADRPERVLDED